MTLSDVDYVNPPESEDFQEGLFNVDQEAPELDWKEFIYPFRDTWAQGQHVAIIGPTDSGKTTLAFHLLPIHIYVCIFGTKPRDKNLDKITWKPKGQFQVKKKAPPPGKYLKLERWEDLPHHKFPRRIIWPDAKDMYSAQKQKGAFQQAMQVMYREGGWTLYIDELWFLGRELGMEHEVRMWLQQIRSNNGTLLVSSQRPSRIPVEVYDQSRHLFFFRDNDERNLSRMSGIAYRSAGMIRHTVANLKPFQCLYVNTRSGEMYRLICPELKG